MSDRETLAAEARRWREDPDGAIRFVRSQFAVEPDPGQAAALVAYQTSKRMGMKASKGTGKTTVLAWCGWHFLAVYPDCNGAAASITMDNLRDGLWKELAKWQAKSKLLQKEFQWTKERIVHKTRSSTWWLAARGWPKTANRQQQSSTLAGLHGEYVLFLLDETGSMPRAILATAEAALSSGKVCRIAMAGNPTSIDGPLYDACSSEAHLWKMIMMTGDPEDPKRSPRVDIQWARDQIQKYGRNSPWVKVNVFGEFPEASFNTLLSPDDVHSAMTRHLVPSQFDWSQKRLGVDVARFGDDLTVIFPRQGLASFRPVAMSHVRDSAVSTDIASRVLLAKARWRSEMEFFDGTGGWAAGARDVLVTAGHSPYMITYNAPSPDPAYVNMRAYMWMTGAEWVKNGGGLPNVAELIGELTIPQYTYVNGKFQIEPKELIKERLGRSPNYADALFNTFAIPDQPAQSRLVGLMVGQEQQRALTQFDPYRDEE